MAATTQSRQATRAVRSAPTMGLRGAADAAGLPPERFADDLRIQMRGRCAKLAADTAAGDHIPNAIAALAWRLCPPPAKHLAAVHNPAAVRASEIAAWTVRDLDVVWRPAQRSTFASAAASTSGDLRNAAAAGALCPPAILAALAQTNDSRTRADVAANDACDPGLLTVLAYDSDRKVNWKAAANPQHRRGCRR